MICYIGLGSNLGDREASIRRAIEGLGREPGISVRAVSPMFATRPWGSADQPEFINAACEIETDLEPRRLLGRLKALERSLGRRSRARWGPREIDLDILFYGSEIVEEADLRIPHPHIPDRGFVLAPLAEIAPDLRHPATGRTVSEDLCRLEDNGDVSWRSLAT
jgi:2-amino-4-hydroxy-6-hydroxymethyldihydropteridine diphosphokinase